MRRMNGTARSRAAGSSGNIEKFPLVSGIEALVLLADRGAAGERDGGVWFRYERYSRIPAQTGGLKRRKAGK